VKILTIIYTYVILFLWLYYWSAYSVTWFFIAFEIIKLVNKCTCTSIHCNYDSGIFMAVYLWIPLTYCNCSCKNTQNAKCLWKKAEIHWQYK